MQTFIIKLNGKEMGRFKVSTADLPSENDKVLLRVSFAYIWLVHYSQVSLDESDE